MDSTIKIVTGVYVSTKVRLVLDGSQWVHSKQMELLNYQQIQIEAEYHYPPARVKSIA